MPINVPIYQPSISQYNISNCENVCVSYAAQNVLIINLQIHKRVLKSTIIQLLDVSMTSILYLIYNK